MPKSWVTPGTGQLIKDFLREVDEAYPREPYSVSWLECRTPKVPREKVGSQKW